jgi:hypothetical protein
MKVVLCQPFEEEPAMPKAKNAKPRVTAPRKKKESLKEIYARLKREFTAADLQKYTVIEKGIPLENVIAEMEEIHRRHEARRNKAR